MFSFSENLKYLRKKRGLTQKQVAQGIDVGERLYQSYEYGKVVPSVTVLADLAAFFNVPSDFFLGVGLFAYWDTINSHWDLILNNIKKLGPPFSSFFDLFQAEKIEIVQVLSCLVDRFSYDEETNTLTMHWKIK